MSCCLHDTARICCRVEFAAERRAAAPLLLSAGACCTARLLQQSLDISWPPGAQQQTRRTLLLRSVDGTD